MFFEQNRYSTKQAKSYEPMLLQWPNKAYFKKLKPDAVLLQKALTPENRFEEMSVSQQIFGNDIKQQYIGLKHSANLFAERCQIHKNHIQEIDRRHMEAQEKLFGVKINNSPDKSKRLGNLEAQLAQLEKERRDEELAFWKDTAEVREKLFESAGNYKDAKHRSQIFSDVEVSYGR